MTPEEFRRRGHQLVDWIADYRARVSTLPVVARTEPGAVKRQLPASPPDAPEDFDAILQDLEATVVPGLTHWAHPQFCGYFPSNSELSSVLGDLLSTGLGVLGLAWQSSPALTELEEVTTDWLRQMVGLSEAWSGVIQDSASTSTLVALTSARERTTVYCRDRGGLQAEPRPLVVYVSSQAHSSVRKAALIAGFGETNLRVIPHDAAFAMRADALGAAVEDDLLNGRTPCAVVATTGTTATTAVDPIAEIAAIAMTHGLWLHVDAAMAGSAMILPECRWMWAGVERADSVVLDPHKWLGASFDCSLYYVRDPAHLTRVMNADASYLRSAADGQVKNLRDWGIPLGRRFRALKLWCLVREQGVAGLSARLRRDLANARWLESEVRQARGWQVVAPVVLQTVAVRYDPRAAAARAAAARVEPSASAHRREALNRHTQAWVARVNQSGEACITAAEVDGEWMARVSIGALQTTRDHVANVWAVMRREAEHFPLPPASRILDGI
ncbi:MAG: pyridoxal-dependent decarboxylase [Acidobacteriota bacterium]